MSINKKILTAALMAATFFGVNAQVGINTTDPSPNSALHIVAPNGDKGVLFPQLTDADINGIVPVTEMPNPNDPSNPIGVNEDGLLVYNTQTGCYNYYNKAIDEWISLCGTPPPAVFEVENCVTGVKAVGIYMKDQVFGINNYLQVKVNVLKAGTYTMAASTNTNNGNGYFFSANGTFPTTGTYTINLAGVGTPVNSGINPIDFTNNGREQICGFPLVINESTPDYIITDAKPIPSNPWPVSTSFDNTYYAEVTLLVNRPGEWRISSSSVNGYQFSGSGMIQEAAGYNPNGIMPQTVKVNVPVVLPGKAITYNTGVDVFVLSTSNAVTYSNCSMNVPLVQTQFTVDCAVANVSTLQSLMQGQVISTNAKIVLSVTAPAAYTTTITADFAGLSFSSGEITLAVGQSNITLKPTTIGQSPSQSGTFPIQFASSNGGMIDCPNPVSVSVYPAQAVFSYVNIIGATNNAEYLVDRRSGGVDTPCDLTVRVIASTAGEYYFTTTVNGVTWMSSGVVSAGTSIITLYPVSPTINRPVSLGTKSVSVKYSAAGYLFETNAIDVSFVTRQINILSIGERDMDRMTPGTDAYYSANAILKNTDNFGKNGRVGVNSVNIVNGGDKPGFNTLRNLINSNKIDIVFFAGGNPLGSSSNAVNVAIVLNSFIAKGGVVIFAGQDEASTQSFLNTLYGTSSIRVTFHTGSAQFEVAQSGLSHKILNGGLWGNSYMGQGVKTDFAGKYIGDDTGYGNRVTPSTLPGTATAIATWQGMSMVKCPVGAVLMFVDDSKNLFFSGDWAWAKGSSNTSYITDSYPAPHSYGNPVIKSQFFDDGYGGVENGPVVNSFLYTNVMAWAIETAAEKRQDGDI